MNFILRSNEPRLTRAHIIPPFDAILKDIFAFTTDTCADAISNLSWNIARLRPSDGECGIGFFEDNVEAAYVASFTTSLNSITSANPIIKSLIDFKIDPLSMTQIDDSFPPSLQSYFDGIDTLALHDTLLKDNSPISLKALYALPSSSHKGLQKILSLKLKSEHLPSIIDELSQNNPALLALLISNASDEANAWISACPNSSSMQMKPEV